MSIPDTHTMAPDYTHLQGQYLAFIYYYTKINGQSACTGRFTTLLPGHAPLRPPHVDPFAGARIYSQTTGHRPQPDTGYTG